MRKKVDLTIVIPMYNSEGWISRTLQSIYKSLEKSDFQAEIIVVDDGSTDDSTNDVKKFNKTHNPKVKLIRQKNQGRYLARKTGVDHATSNGILFIDSRIDVGLTSLAFLSKELAKEADQIWNGHVNVCKKGNIFARFWDAIALIGWRKYFKNPRRMSYGVEEFDYYPKGTGFLYVPKKKLCDAMNFFESNNHDLKFSSDDTLLIRYLAERQPINLSPEFFCDYHNGRTTLKSFLKHAYHRGQFFVDGFLRKGTRFFWPLVGVLILSVVIIICLVCAFIPSIYIILAGVLLFILTLFFGGLILGLCMRDALSLALLGVPFACVYLLGIWRGVIRKCASYFVKKRRV